MCGLISLTKKHMDDTMIKCAACGADVVDGICTSCGTPAVAPEMDMTEEASSDMPSEETM